MEEILHQLIGSFSQYSRVGLYTSQVVQDILNQPYQTSQTNGDSSNEGCMYTNMTNYADAGRFSKRKTTEHSVFW